MPLILYCGLRSAKSYVFNVAVVWKKDNTSLVCLLLQEEMTVCVCVCVTKMHDINDVKYNNKDIE